ncbi:MAG: hypothetical protein ACI9AR_000445 [Flavobacteriaceae bacterium]|jgi:hypothetical protein
MFIPFIKNNKKAISVLVVSILMIVSVGFFAKVQATGDQVYLHYSDDTASAKVLDIYQKKANAGTAVDKWFRWSFFQYGSDNVWDLQKNKMGSVVALTLETDRDDFTYTEGSADTGSYTTWTPYTTGDIISNRRDSLSGYVPYSAYATYTATDDYSDMYLGVHNNAAVNGEIRVKINDVASTTGIELDGNGEYDEAAHGSDNTNVDWIHIGTDISNGDVIKIEAKGGTLNDRHVITGLRLYQEANPGDAAWDFIKTKDIMASTSEQYIAMSGGVPGQTAEYMFGYAHGHEYNPSLTIDLDATAYTVDGNLSYDQVITGGILSMEEATTAYGDTKTTDDFGTLTRTMEFSGNQLQQDWNFDFTADYAVTRVYSTMWPASYTTESIFRYVQFGDSFVTLLPNDGAVFPTQVGPATTSGKMSYFGGTANLRVDIETTVNLEEEWITSNGQKSYFFASRDDYNGLKGSGDSFGSETTITLTHEEPASVSWLGKTLYVARDKTINTDIDFVPFDAKGTVVKMISGSSIGLDFAGYAPSKTYFTSQNNNSVGIAELLSTGSPVAGDWSGLTVSGSVFPLYNIISYATTGATLTGNASIYNSSFNQNTTGINADSGSYAQNNALANSATYTAGAADFDYNCFDGNLEANGVDGDPLFANEANGNFVLQASSPCINAGVILGDTYKNALSPLTVWPTSIVSVIQDANNTDWEIGAYAHPFPIAPTIGSPTAFPSAIRWGLTDNSSDETGFKVYDSLDALKGTLATADSLYVEETGLTENTEYAGRYVTAYNIHGDSEASGVSASIYTLAEDPVNLFADADKTSISLTAEAFENDTVGTSGYFFESTDSNSGWITTNTWTDTGLDCGDSKTYTIKYRNADGVETSTASLTKSTSGCSSGSGSYNYNNEINIYNFEIKAISETSASLSWKTNQNTDTHLQYGTTQSYGSNRNNDVYSQSHSVEINDLTPNTRYYVKVTSSSKYGSRSTSKTSSFITTKTYVAPIPTSAPSEDTANQNSENTDTSASINTYQKENTSDTDSDFDIDDNDIENEGDYLLERENVEENTDQYVAEEENKEIQKLTLWQRIKRGFSMISKKIINLF